MAVTLKDVAELAGVSRSAVSRSFTEGASVSARTRAKVEKAARVFWDEIAAESPTKAKVVEIFKQYNADMEKAGRPYRYT